MSKYYPSDREELSRFHPFFHHFPLELLSFVSNCSFHHPYRSNWSTSDRNPPISLKNLPFSYFPSQAIIHHDSQSSSCHLVRYAYGTKSLPFSERQRRLATSSCDATGSPSNPHPVQEYLEGEELRGYLDHERFGCLQYGDEWFFRGHLRK